MKTSTRTKKEFDAVSIMRSIREKVGKEIRPMTFEEEKNYLIKQKKKYFKGKPIDK